MTLATQSGLSRAAVPRLTRVQPVARAAASEASSRMPPDSSTLMSRVSVIPRTRSRLEPVPKAASRSTRCSHSAPAVLPGEGGGERLAEGGLGAGGALDQADGLPVPDVDGGQQFEAAHEVHVFRGQRVLTQLVSRAAAGVAGLLGVELGGPERAVLDRRHERLPVRGPGDQRRVDPRAVRLQLPVPHPVGVDEVEAGVRVQVEANIRLPSGASTVFQPMCGTTGASSGSTVPGHSSQPHGLHPVLDALLEEDLHADADTHDRSAAGQPAVRRSSPRGPTSVRACRPRRRRRRGRAGRRRPSPSGSRR